MNIDELTKQFSDLLDNINTTLDLLNFEKSINNIMNKKKIKLKNEELIDPRASNVDLFIHYYQSQLKKQNLTSKQLSKEIGVSITTLYKIERASFGVDTDIPSIRMRTKIVDYLKNRENNANK